MERDEQEPLSGTRTDAVAQERQRVRAATISRVSSGGLPVLLVIALVIATCAALIASGVLRGSAGQPGADGFRTTGLFGCFGSAPGFTTDQLPSGGPGAEAGPGARAAALRAFIAQNPDMPASGWKLMRVTGSTELYWAPFPAGGFVEVSLEPGTPDGASYGADGWRTAGYGGCPLMAVPPSGLSSATWGLDPAVPFAAGATDLHVLVDEWECHGNSTAEGRISQNVTYGEASVLVTLAVQSRYGFQTCPGTPPTPYVVHLTQPVGTRDLFDGGVWPQHLIATAGLPYFTPTPTPEPANWHMPMDCTGEADGPGSFKADSMSAKFDVYCAALPDGWRRTAMDDHAQVVTSVTVTYRGPEGEVVVLTEGDFCTESPKACAPWAEDLGTAMFGDRHGELVKGPPGADFALYVDPGLSPSWKATGSGMTVESFKVLTAALIVVAK
jgi:hypothetical protein